jgi:hypothetical protein
MGDVEDRFFRHFDHGPLNRWQSPIVTRQSVYRRQAWGGQIGVSRGKLIGLPPRDDLTSAFAGKEEGAMILGMSLQAFTLLHVVISLVAIVTGFIVVIGMIDGKPLPAWTALFLLTTVLTSVTGFMFPFGGITPGMVIGIISSVLLAFALFALYIRHLTRAWRWIYAVTAIAALYLNVFVSIVQAFQKIEFLRAMAPTQSEPPFLIVQGAALGMIIVLGVLAVVRFRPGIPVTAPA